MVTVNTPANDRDQSWNERAAAAQGGDRKAYELLLRDIVPYIRAIVAGTLPDSVSVDDVVQEVLLSVHKSLHTYSPDRPFRPWLTSIVYFRKTDYLRRHYGARRHRQVSTDSMDFYREHVTSPARSGEYKDVEAILGALPDKQRRAFELMKIQGYTAKEVAMEMDMSESAVKVSVHRTMKKLQGMTE